MKKYLLAALGLFLVAGVASAQTGSLYYLLQRISNLAGQTARVSESVTAEPLAPDLTSTLGSSQINTDNNLVSTSNSSVSGPVSGYQVVLNEVVNTGSTVNVTCPSGKTVLGGGCNLGSAVYPPGWNGPAHFYSLEDSFPISAVSAGVGIWSCSWNGPTDLPYRKQAIAICANVQ